MKDLINLIMAEATQVENTNEKGRNGVCRDCCSRQDTFNYKAYMPSGAIYRVELCKECAGKCR